MTNRSKELYSMSDCCDEKLINGSDLIEWIMETYPDWCVYPIRGIVDRINEMPSKTIQDSRFGYWIEGGCDGYDYTCSECWDHPGCSIERDVADTYMGWSKMFLVDREMIGMPKVDGYSATKLIEKDE